VTEAETDADPLGIATRRKQAMQCVFVQIQCKPGQAYKVADAIALKEVHSELYSTSGQYDLLLKIYVPKDQDIGHYLSDTIFSVEGIERTLTTMTFTAF
jgi:DNA-binding Lrp family transcriptional regulator